ncbi:MAG: hypothetical protein M1837_003668 [Sclerophora amabilis]|nr:MAG: hypothetical protein M1837_003668 [Sclerophora amabilis]
MDTKRVGHGDYERFENDIRKYFKERTDKLQIIKTTKTRSGKKIDWVPMESQGHLATPPPEPSQPQMSTPLQFELDEEGVEKGPEGTVPIPRKDLDAISFNRPLEAYLSKTRGSRRGMSHLLGPEADSTPAPQDTSAHRYGSSQQAVTCYGGQGNLSYWDPSLEAAGDFSLLQIGMINANSQQHVQTVEAGWQVYQELHGDYAPHLFTYYTTNGYSQQGNNLGGYDTDVGGWVQYDSTIFPGTTFSPTSIIGGTQSALPIKYQLFQGNWWLSCTGRWIGYYPAALFTPGGSLGDHADHIGFWGEVFDSDEVPGRTKTDMGSGRFPSEGWTNAAYLSNLKYQADAAATNLPNYDGSAGLVQEDTDMYRIEPHFQDTGEWGSYAWVGGPGTG